MKNVRISISFILLGYVLIFGMSIQNTPDKPNQFTSFLKSAKYPFCSGREVVFILPENGCLSSIEGVTRYISEQSFRATKVLIVAEGMGVLKYDDRFAGLKFKDPLFVETSVAHRHSLYLYKPIFAFVENSKVVQSIYINCETFEPAKAKVKLFLTQPNSEAYREVAMD